MELKLLILILVIQCVQTNDIGQKGSCYISSNVITYRCIEDDREPSNCKHIVSYKPVTSNTTTAYSQNISYSLQLCTSSITNACLHIDKSWQTLHCPSWPVRPVMTCQLPRNMIKKLYDRSCYGIVLNADGVNCSTTFHKAKKSFCAQEFIIPLPPQNVTPTLIEKRSVTFAWTEPISATYDSPEYTILFHSEYDEDNKTISCKALPQCTVPNLHAGSQYWFWFKLTLLDVTDAVSHPGGPIYLLTHQDIPDEAPSFELEEHNVNKNQRNINVKLQYPNKQKWNGNISRVDIFFCDSSSRNHTCGNTDIQHKALNSTSSNITLPNLNRDVFTTVWTGICTEVGCINSSVGTLPPNLDASSATSKSNYKYIKEIVLPLVAVLIIAAVVVMVYIYNTKRRNLSTHQSGSEQGLILDYNSDPSYQNENELWGDDSDQATYQ